MLKNPLKKPSAIEMATEELEQAEKSLLGAQAAAEYAMSMCQYHEARIKRLKAYLGSDQTPNQQPTVEA